MPAWKAGAKAQAALAQLDDRNSGYAGMGMWAVRSAAQEALARTERAMSPPTERMPLLTVLMQRMMGDRPGSMRVVETAIAAATSDDPVQAPREKQAAIDTLHAFLTPPPWCIKPQLPADLIDRAEDALAQALGVQVNHLENLRANANRRAPARWHRREQPADRRGNAGRGMTKPQLAPQVLASKSSRR
jgi:hypothetical protein